MVESDNKYLNGISSIFYGNPNPQEENADEHLEDGENPIVEEEEQLFDKLLGD